MADTVEITVLRMSAEMLPCIMMGGDVIDERGWVSGQGYERRNVCDVGPARRSIDPSVDEIDPIDGGAGVEDFKLGAEQVSTVDDMVGMKKLKTDGEKKGGCSWLSRN